MLKQPISLLKIPKLIEALKDIDEEKILNILYHFLPIHTSYVSEENLSFLTYHLFKDKCFGIFKFSPRSGIQTLGMIIKNPEDCESSNYFILHNNSKKDGNRLHSMTKSQLKESYGFSYSWFFDIDENVTWYPLPNFTDASTVMRVSSSNPIIVFNSHKYEQRLRKNEMYSVLIDGLAKEMQFGIKNIYTIRYQHLYKYTYLNLKFGLLLCIRSDGTNYNLLIATSYSFQQFVLIIFSRNTSTVNCIVTNT